MALSLIHISYGNWVLKELESPEGFILSDEVIPVTVELSLIHIFKEYIGRIMTYGWQGNASTS